MHLTDFDQETVESFLDYIYGEQKFVPGQNVFKRRFDKKRLTAELLRFCHMYDLRSLLEMCIEHLRKNMDDGNAVEVWTVAEAIGHEDLKKVALEYLGKKKDKLLEVSGVEESFQEPQLVKSLVNYLIRQPVLPEAEDTITLNVQCRVEYYGNIVDSVKVQVKLSDTVKILKGL